MNYVILLAQGGAFYDKALEIMSKNGIAGVITILITGAFIYVVFPVARKWLGDLMKRPHKKERTIEEVIHDRMIGRIEQLDAERELHIENMRKDNKVLSDRLDKAMGEFRSLQVKNERLERKMRSFEWLLLVDICDELSAKIEKNKIEMSEKLVGLGRDDMAEMLKVQFEALINETKQGFVIRQLESQTMLEDDEEEAEP